jgi:uncharacterized protein (DUF58 family)
VAEALLDRAMLERLERLAIHWKKSLPGLVGGHNTSRFSGPGQEFLDHRQFYQGDDMRAVNWRVYMRLEKLVLKMFQLEPRIPVRMLIDTSKSMMTGEDESKFDYARKLAGALCYVGLVRLDSMCLQPFGAQLGDSFTASGGRHRFQPALNFLSALEAGGQTNFLKSTREFISKYPQKGLVIVLSDFLDDGECEKPLQFLSDFGHELILIQLFDPSDREPPWEGELELEDAETGQHVELAFDADARANYTAAFDEYSQSIRRVALRNNGRYVSLPTNVPVDEAIFGPLVRSGAVE